MGSKKHAKKKASFSRENMVDFLMGFIGTTLIIALIVGIYLLSKGL